MLRYQKGYICNGYTFVVNKEDVHNATDDMFVNATALLPDGWVSVKERLPEAKGEYLVAYHPCWWDDVKYDKMFVGLDSFRGKTTWAKRKFQCVTHWMYLPEPPKEEA